MDEPLTVLEGSVNNLQQARLCSSTGFLLAREGYANKVPPLIVLVLLV